MNKQEASCVLHCERETDQCQQRFASHGLRNVLVEIDVFRIMLPSCSLIYTPIEITNTLIYKSLLFRKLRFTVRKDLTIHIIHKHAKFRARICSRNWHLNGFMKCCCFISKWFHTKELCLRNHKATFH